MIENIFTDWQMAYQCPNCRSIYLPDKDIGDFEACYCEDTRHECRIIAIQIREFPIDG